LPELRQEAWSYERQQLIEEEHMDMSRNRKKGKAKQAIGLLFMLLSLTSCGRLKSNHAIEAGIREILPDAVILNVETTIQGAQIQAVYSRQ
jgi:hypothetical protein